MLAEIVNNSKLLIQQLLIGTGNILNDTTAPLTSKEELLDALKCMDCLAADAEEVKLIAKAGNSAHLLRGQRELQEKILENQRNEISIGAKLFINNVSDRGMVEEAVKALMDVLKVEHVDNLVVACPQGGAGMDINNLKTLWNVLQEFAEQKQICQLGIADIDINTLQELQQTRVPPSIVQINLANCCVVPPELKDFCTQHDIQLLTHGDDEVLICDDDFIIPNFKIDWLLRYQIHVRCRGVLTAKGYILQTSKKDAGAAIP